MSDLTALTADLAKAISALSEPMPDSDQVFEQAESIGRRLEGMSSRASSPAQFSSEEFLQTQRLFQQYAGLLSMRQGQIDRALGSLGLNSPAYRVGTHGHGSAISNPRHLRSSA